MSGINYAFIIFFGLLALIIFSLTLSWRKRAALKPNLAQIRNETEAEILKEHEKEEH